MDAPVNLKMIVVGDSSVGKSSLITQYIDHTFRDYNVAT
jgi:GTPase SAR1 family protein